MSLVPEGITKEQKPYQPIGTFATAMYDRRKVVVLSGPTRSGKSLMVLNKLYILLENYPGARILFTRRTRASMSETLLYTWEEQVVPVGHPCLRGNKRSHVQTYEFPNGSIVVVCGLDDINKIMSGEFDIIYIQEVIEDDERDAQLLLTRLSGQALPYTQLICCTNPTYPEHWVYRWHLQNKLKMYFSTHYDNPVFFEQAPPNIVSTNDRYPEESPDGRIGRWTERGREYIFETLGNLSGVERQRMVLGLWVKAEGIIYDMFDEQIHVIEPFQIPDDWRRIWVIDFGFTNPMVVHKYAISPENKNYLYKEFYKSHTTVEEMVEEVLYDSGWKYNEINGLHKIRPNAEPLPEIIVADHDAEGRATWDAKSSLTTTAAFKKVGDGIDAVKSHLNDKSFFVFNNALVQVDDRMLLAGKPINLVSEMKGYVWKEDKEEPVKLNDHACDTLRYFVAHIDGLRLRYKADDVASEALASAIVMIPHKSPTEYGSILIPRIGKGKGRSNGYSRDQGTDTGIRIKSTNNGLEITWRT